MIKGLKRRFIIIAMSIIGIITLAIFVFICIFTYSSQMKEALRILDQSSFHFEKSGFESIPPGNSPTPMPDSRPRDELFQLPDIYIFKVKISTDGITSSETDSTIDKELLERAVTTVQNDKDEHGRVKGASLLYSKKITPDGLIISFTSSSNIDTGLRNTVFLSISLWLVSLLLFSILVERLAHHAIRPVEAFLKAQQQFIQDASHDLKTPLTVILANTDILLSANLENKDGEKWLLSTRDESLKMKGLVEQMLELAKSESSSAFLSITAFDASETTEQAVLQLESVAFERQLTIDTCISPNIVLSTDINAYLRIVQILLDNAIRYSAQNTSIKVVLAEERQRAVLQVTSCSFISEEHINHIFERFYRGSKSRSDGGHGLGLAIAKSISLLLKGDLTVKSSETEGTTFTLSLPKKSK